VEGISQACVSNPDERLYEVLRAVIAEAERWMPAPVTQVSQRESVEAK
jgi:hypothetical protein